LCRLPTTQGRIMIGTTRDVMRWTRQRWRVSFQCRVSRERLTRAQTNALHADGDDVWAWHPCWCPRRDCGEPLPGLPHEFARLRDKRIVRRGERGLIRLKPFRRNAGVPVTVVTTWLILPFCTRPFVQTAPAFPCVRWGIPCPFGLLGGSSIDNSCSVRCENADCVRRHLFTGVSP